jgi:hypothetical protein
MLKINVNFGRVVQLHDLIELFLESGAWPAQLRTGRRGYFGKSGRVSCNPQRQ